MRATKVIVLGIAVVALSLATAGAGDYIGAKKCKLCHKTEYTSWEQTPHAKAFDKLKPEEQGKAECLKCHATGGTADLPGVQCESCHGAGSEYKSMKIMKDQEAAIAAGLVLPDQALCVSCHEGAPHDQAAFNYEEAKKTGLHEVKAKE